jgi:N-dimethylarginine dimethylaminohydrolase
MIMSNSYGCQSNVQPIQRLLLKHPREAFQNPGVVGAQWKDLNYLDQPDFQEALAEYDEVVEQLGRFVSDVQLLPEHPLTGLDSIYVHDPLLVTKAGAILCNMGKDQRREEPGAMRSTLEQMNIPVRGAITGDGRLEGGDVIWLDEETLVVGQGYRTNAEGIRQLRALTTDLVRHTIVVSLPHWNGPGDVLHLMSLISPIDHDLALVYRRLLPVPFLEALQMRAIQLIDVPDEEYDSMGCNVLAIQPRRCLMLEGNPVTKARLEAAGATVSTYKGSEISLKGCGGPTCLTRPVLRGL